MKNLEQEYRKLTADNVPDLWSRIEAGIDKIEAEKAECEAEKVECEAEASESGLAGAEASESGLAGVEASESGLAGAEASESGLAGAESAAGVAEVVDLNSYKKKKVSKASMTRYITTAVAAAALVLSCGAYILLGGSRKSEAPAATEAYMSDSAASEAASESWADEAASESWADEAPAEEASWAGEAAESAVAEEAASEETNWAEEASWAEEAAEAATESWADEATEAPTKDAAMDAEKSELNISRVRGQVDYCDDKRFIDVTRKDGQVIRMYVPEDMAKEIAEAVKSGETVAISYKEIDTKLIDKLDKASADLLSGDYSDVRYYVSKIS